MANQCNVCKKKIGIFDTAIQVTHTAPDYTICEDCYRILLNMRGIPSADKYQEYESHFAAALQDPTTPTAIKTYFGELRTKWEEKTERKLVNQAQKEQEETQYQQNYEAMIMTTGSLFEGYHITKYHDIICEEVIFKNSFMNRLSAGFEDIGNALSFQEREMSGSGELIARAREYVQNKFRQKAARLGANAVLGVEFESSIGADVVRVAVFGTAVSIEKD